MKVPEPEVPVAEFYKSVMSHRRPEVQSLVIKLLGSEFKQASDLEAHIFAVAAESMAESIREGCASDASDIE